MSSDNPTLNFGLRELTLYTLSEKVHSTVQFNYSTVSYSFLNFLTPIYFFFSDPISAATVLYSCSTLISASLSACFHSHFSRYIISLNLHSLQKQKLSTCEYMILTSSACLSQYIVVGLYFIFFLHSFSIIFTYASIPGLFSIHQAIPIPP